MTSALPVRVLLVEAGTATADAVRAALPPPAFQVHTTARSDRVFEELERSDADVVLVEHGMSGTGAVTLIQRLRALDDRRELPVIALVATPHRHGVLELLEAGATDFMDAHPHPALLRERVLAVHRARTARRNLERGLRLRDRLVEVVCREMREPLKAIGGYARFLGDATPAAVHSNESQAVHRIAVQAARAERLIDDLVDVMCFELGQLELELAPVDLVELAGECVDRCRLPAAAKRIELKFEARPGDRIAPVDAPRIQQVIDNLLSNAVKFTPSGGNIHVAVDPREDGVHLIVADSGPGIPERELSRLFTLFGRLSTRPTSGESGAGMGLYIARHLVERHGGRLDVESTPGHGATFRCVVPRAPQRGAPPCRRSSKS